FRPTKFRVPVVSEPISGFVFNGVARSSSVWPAMPLVDVITTSFVRLRILSTLSRKMSNRDVGRSFSSRQCTWMIAAPSCSHRYAVSAISSGVTGTWRVLLPRHGARWGDRDDELVHAFRPRPLRVDS